MTRGRNGVRLISRRTGVIEGIRARKLAGKEFRPAHQPLPALRVEESGSRLQECHPHRSSRPPYRPADDYAGRLRAQ
jgi:hypothetical protein